MTRRSSLRAPGPTGSPPVGPGIRARLRGRLRDGDRGATPIELAILLPVIVFMIFISVQIALYFLAREEALAAAEETVNQVRGYQHQTSADKTAAQQRGTDFLNGGGARWLHGATVPPPTINGNDIDVTVTGYSISMFPGWNIYIAEHAHATVEHTTQVP